MRRFGPSSQHRTRIGAEKKTPGATGLDIAAEHLTRYEALRARVAEGEARQDELAAMACQGMLRGLGHLALAQDAVRPTPQRLPREAPPLAGDGEFVNVLANIVLRIQSEASHVY
jgi:hypothetical protein